MGKLKEVQGASWDLEVGTLTDLNVKSRKWTLLFDKIQDYSPGYRVLTGSLLDSARVALTLGLSPDLDDRQLVTALRQRIAGAQTSLDRFPSHALSTAPFLENRCEGSEVDLTKFPAMKWHERDGGRYLGTLDAIVTRWDSI
jgi:UbiD family decarboxylase